MSTDAGGVAFTYAADAIRAAEEPLLADGGDARLMARAADAIAAEATAMLHSRGGEVRGSAIVLLVGTGKNGGDALLAGARLARSGAEVTAVLTGSTAHEAGLLELRDAGGTVVELGLGPAPSAEALHATTGAELIIDGIAGLGAMPGLRSPADGLVAALPPRIPILAVDLPSGLAADSEEASLPHVMADVTVTFSALKRCLVLPPAALAAGRVVIADLGIPLPSPVADAVRRLTISGAAALWPVPGATDDKYSRGVLGVVAGSEAYPGAAVLTCSAAVRAGAGMVRYVGPSRAADLVLAARPEVVTHAPSENALPRVDAWVLGPGITGDAEQEAFAAVAHGSGVACVVDAGAVEACAMARASGERPTTSDRILLTPHIGELARALTACGRPTTREAVAADPLSSARVLATLSDATVLLKGAVTLVVTPDGSTWSQAEASPWLATAGSGDVLAGIAGALLAAGLPADQAGALAALIHGLAGVRASDGGPIAAADIAEALPAFIEALQEAISGVLRSA